MVDNPKSFTCISCKKRSEAKRSYPMCRLCADIEARRVRLKNMEEPEEDVIADYDAGDFRQCGGGRRVIRDPKGLA